MYKYSNIKGGPLNPQTRSLFYLCWKSIRRCMNVLKQNENVITIWKKLKCWMYDISYMNKIKNPNWRIHGTRCSHRTCYDFIKNISHVKYLLIRLKVDMCSRELFKSYWKSIFLGFSLLDLLGSQLGFYF